MTVPVGSGDEVVIVGGAGWVIVIDRGGGVGSVCPVESVTFAVKSNVPVALAVPAITPVEGFKLRPVGSAPVKPQTKGGVPPETCRVSL